MSAVRERPQRTVQRRRGSAGRIVALLLLIAGCWATLLATTPPATGNPVLTSTSPGNGELVKSPDSVRLTFDRPVPAGLATVRILDPGTGEQVVFERPTHPGGDEDSISVPLPKERHEGTYAVAWTLPSSGLEPLRGSFTFDVFSTITPDGVPDIETTHDMTISIIYNVLRVAALAAMLLLIGAAFYVAAISVPTRRAQRVVQWSFWALVVATLGTFFSFGPYAAWAPLSGAFDPRLVSGAAESGIGGALLSRLYLLVLLGLALWQLMTAPPAETSRERRIRGGVVLACAGALAATWVFATARGEGTPSPMVLAVDVVLVLAVAVVVGGLVLFLASRRRDPGVNSRYRVTALCCAGLLAVTGAYQVWQGIGWLIASTTSSAPAAIRDQVAPTRLAYDTGKPGGQGSLDLVLIPATDEAGQVRLDARVTVLGDTGGPRGDVLPTAVLNPPNAGAAPVPLALSVRANGLSQGEAKLPGKGTWTLALTLRTGDGGMQTITQPIDVR